MAKRAKVNQYLPPRYAFYLINLIVFTLLLLPAMPAAVSLWWLDNLVSLQLQWSLLAILLILINIQYIHRYTLASALFYLMIIAYNQQPLYLSFKTQQQNHLLSSTIQLKIAQLNIRYENPHLDKLTATVSDPEFDVLVLQEAADHQHKQIKALSQYYPYSIGIAPLESTPSGLALFSRWPIVEKKSITSVIKAVIFLKLLFKALKRPYRYRYMRCIRPPREQKNYGS
ncbi:endonuclease/exonuclease/phosphatase family protein [Psychromonas aquimarina]|uniref:endonuclease/exonuclease/phosphatase family protein n=1 Tax=Psychromonas aquimarina TaxID=444919 RepID=UPI00041326ED|nr:endonuclease/exonuclease/phosphatase family protein [Psychromonas aquimarina]